MDLKDLTPKSDTFEVKLVHPNTGDALKNDDKTDMTITVHASHSKEYKAAMHEQTNKRLKAMQSGKKQEITAQDMEEAQALFKNHPHLVWQGGCDIEVHELREM